MRLPIATALATTSVLTATLAFGALSKDDLKLVNKATTVLSEFRNASDIPESVWTKADCVLVIPSLKKAAFIVGGEGGSGVMSCRHSNGAWGTASLHAADERQRWFPGRRVNRPNSCCS